MKILLIVFAFPPKWIGGTELATLSIANALSRKDHEVHVATSHDGEVYESDSEYIFKLHRIRYPKIRLIWDVIFSLKVLKLAFDLKPDIVHAQGIGMGFTALVIKKLLNIKYVLWGRGSDVYGDKSKTMVSKAPLINACAVISLTRRMEKKLLEIHPIENSHVLPNGIDLNKLETSNNNKVSRQQMNIPENVPLITFVGNLRPVKGVKYLIEALGMVLKKNDARLLIIGDGPEREHLQSQTDQLGIREKVTFQGKISKEEIMSYLKISDLFVLPSISEGFPNVILEAMAAGLPIVSTNFEGASEIIRDGENGFMVPVKNPTAMANVISKILDNQDIKQFMAAKNREEIVKYDWNNIIIELEEIYKECV
jgi:glycosyltransferase involved in cell wall biosynthesis